MTASGHRGTTETAPGLPLLPQCSCARTCVRVRTSKGNSADWPGAPGLTLPSSPHIAGTLQVIGPLYPCIHGPYNWPVGRQGPGKHPCCKNSDTGPRGLQSRATSPRLSVMSWGQPCWDSVQSWGPRACPVAREKVTSESSPSTPGHVE